MVPVPIPAACAQGGPRVCRLRPAGPTLPGSFWGTSLSGCSAVSQGRHVWFLFPRCRGDRLLGRGPQGWGLPELCEPPSRPPVGCFPGRAPSCIHLLDMWVSSVPVTGLHCPDCHLSQMPPDPIAGTVITQLWLDMAPGHVDIHHHPHPQRPLVPARGCRDALPACIRPAPGGRIAWWVWCQAQGGGGWSSGGSRVTLGARTLQPLLSTLSPAPVLSS